MKDDLERFGFGSESGIQLPFEWSGRIPDDAVKKELVDKHVLAKGEAPRLLVGDNVQVAIGQGLMAATPLQMANGYSTIANGGFLRPADDRQEHLRAARARPQPGMADLSQGASSTSPSTPTPTRISWRCRPRSATRSSTGSSE